MMRIDDGLRTAAELEVGPPKDNLTILGISRWLAARIERDAIPSDADGRKAWGGSQRTLLRETLRCSTLQVERPWFLFGARIGGRDTRS